MPGDQLVNSIKINKDREDNNSREVLNNPNRFVKRYKNSIFKNENNPKRKNLRKN